MKLNEVIQEIEKQVVDILKSTHGKTFSKQNSLVVQTYFLYPYVLRIEIINKEKQPLRQTIKTK